MKMTKHHLPAHGLTAILILALLLMSTAQAEGMPDDILAKVKAQVISIFPNDYTSQKLELDDQKKCYKYLSNLEPDVPDQIYTNILLQADADFKYDYCLQKLEINDQIKAWKEMNSGEQS